MAELNNEEVYGTIYQTNPAYEGAASSYREGLRGLFNGQSDTLAARELRFLQNRSSHIIRNNGYGKIALKKWTTNANYIKVIWKTKNGKSHKIMQGYWDEFASNPSHDGFGDIRTFQGVSNSSIFTHGNSYIRKLIKRTGNKNTVPLKLQLIPATLHDVYYNNSAVESKTVRYGMTFESSIPTEYHFRKSNLEQAETSNPGLRIAVPAEEIIHTFIRNEPGQWLGIPELSSVILSLYKLDDLVTSTMSKQLSAQSIAILIEQTSSAMNMLPVAPTKTVNDPDNTGKQKVIFKNNAQESQTLYLNKGESAKMFQGTDIGANWGTLVETELRKIAAVLDLAYHELTGDTAGLNFSSLIGISILSRNRLEYLHNFLFIPLREKPIADAFKELAVLYNPKVAGAVPYFQLPRWRGMDDLKDAQADLLELQNGLGTMTDKLAERGLTMDVVLADLEDRKQLEKYGIILNSSGGNPSMKQTGNTEANSNSTTT